MIGDILDSAIRPGGAEGETSLLAWTDDAGGKHILDADITISASDDRALTLTTHAVETGSNISDHIVFQPTKFKCEIAQTQTPHEPVKGFTGKDLVLKYPPTPVRGIVANVVNLVGGLIGANDPDGQITITTLQSDSVVDRVGDLHDQLLDVFNNAYPVKVTFKGRVYKDFLITSVKLSHNKGEFGLGRFTVEIQEFRTVSSAVTKLPDPSKLRAKVNKANGKKLPEDSKPDAGKLRSVLKSGLNAAGITG